jgi:hypothetical protein
MNHNNNDRLIEENKKLYEKYKKYKKLYKNIVDHKKKEEIEKRKKINDDVIIINNDVIMTLNDYRKMEEMEKYHQYDEIKTQIRKYNILVPIYYTINKIAKLFY